MPNSLDGHHLVEHELGDDRLAHAALEVGLELLGGLALVLEVGLHAHAGEGELLGDLLTAGGELLGDQRLRQRDVDLADDLVEHEVAGLVGLLHALAAGDAVEEVGAQLLDGVELRGHLGELVVELGQVPLLDVGDRDGDLDVLALELAADQLAGEGGRAAGLEADDGLVEAVEDLALADRVGHALGLGALDGLAVGVGGGEVDGERVAVLDGDDRPR